MQIEFTARATAPLRASIVNAGALPADLPAAVVRGAQASRFAGKPGQVFEYFAESAGAVLRHTLVGAGEPGAGARVRHLEKAGAALTAKYLASGEEALAIDCAGLSAADVARVEKLIRRARLPVRAPGTLSTARFLELMAVDKKVLNGRLRLVLLQRLGEAVVTDDYPRAELEGTLTSMREAV